MKTYSTYKPSNVEWLGEIPNHWKIERLKDVCENITSGGTPKTSIDIYWENGDIIWVTPTDFQDFENTEYINNSRTKITAAGLKDCSASILPIGTLVMQSRASIGLAKISATELCTNQGFINFTSGHALNNKFLFYLIDVYLGDFYQGTASGTTYMEIPRSKAKQEKIPLPPFTEQTAIAAYLDQATANIDKVIATKQQQLEKLEQYKQSKIHECVTKGIPMSEPAEDGGIPMKPSGIDWIGDVPGHWRKIKLRYEIEIQSGEFVSNTELETGGDYPVFGGNGIMGYVSKFNIENERLIIGRVGAKCGNVHHVGNLAWISDNALILATYHNYRYLFYLLTEMNLNSISSQSAQPLITGTKIKNEYVVLPPIDEQKEIANYLNDFTSNIGKEKNIIEQQIEKLKQYRKSLIHECVTGKRKIV